jgi:hypothetical protein
MKTKVNTHALGAVALRAKLAKILVVVFVCILAMTIMVACNTTVLSGKEAADKEFGGGGKVVEIGTGSGQFDVKTSLNQVLDNHIQLAISPQRNYQYNVGMGYGVELYSGKIKAVSFGSQVNVNLKVKDNAARYNLQYSAQGELLGEVAVKASQTETLSSQIEGTIVNRQQHIEISEQGKTPESVDLESSDNLNDIYDDLQVGTDIYNAIVGAQLDPMLPSIVDIAGVLQDAPSVLLSGEALTVRYNDSTKVYTLEVKYDNLLKSLADLIAQEDSTAVLDSIKLEDTSSLSVYLATSDNGLVLKGVYASIETTIADAVLLAEINEAILGISSEDWNAFNVDSLKVSMDTKLTCSQNTVRDSDVARPNK